MGAPALTGRCVMICVLCRRYEFAGNRRGGFAVASAWTRIAIARRHTILPRNLPTPRYPARFVEEGSVSAAHVANGHVHYAGRLDDGVPILVIDFADRHARSPPRTKSASMLLIRKSDLLVEPCRLPVPIHEAGVGIGLQPQYLAPGCAPGARRSEGANLASFGTRALEFGRRILVWDLDRKDYEARSSITLIAARRSPSARAG